MNTTTTPLDERLVEASIGALEILSIHLGRTLGLYGALRTPSTVGELAVEAAIDERYAREWLEQQTIAGFVDVDEVAAPWDGRRYVLNATQMAAFLTPDDPSHVSPLADMVVGAAEVIRKVAAAYRTGGGVPYADYGPVFRAGQAGINRPAFTHDLVDSWVEAAGDVVVRLESGGRIADLGCGEGWSTLALARRFPNAEVVGIDSDPSSIEAARRHAADAPFDVAFELADAAGGLGGEFDLVLILEALHDMAAPVEALAAARRSLTEGGTLLLADENVAADFGAIGDQLERMMYGWSVVHCLPASMAEEGSSAIGTVLRPGHVSELALEAGFTSVEQSDVDAGFFRLYVMR